MGPIFGIGIGALGAPAAIFVALVPLWLAATYATARTAYHYSTQKRTRELRRLADRLADLAEALCDPAQHQKVFPM
jgi:hypothetical protein